MCFELQPDGDHIKCPHCGAKWYVKWTTEYGDPMVGEHEAECPKCSRVFMFDVYHDYNSWAKPV